MRLIDADELCKVCREHGSICMEKSCEIPYMPTVDAVEVVRCKDCKQWQRHTEVNRDYGPCRRYGSTMRFDDFCSYGEKRDAE